MRNRPNLTRLLIFFGVLGAAGAIVGAVMHGSNSADAAAVPPPARPQPTAAPVAGSAPARQPVQDCSPDATGSYVGKHGSVAVRCDLNADGTRWQWDGVVQTSNGYSVAGIGATVTDSTGARWVSKLASGGSKIWVWLPQNNIGWHPPTGSYPAEGVTADS